MLKFGHFLLRKSLALSLSCLHTFSCPSTCTYSLSLSLSLSLSITPLHILSLFLTSEQSVRFFASTEKRGIRRQRWWLISRLHFAATTIRLLLSFISTSLSLSLSLLLQDFDFPFIILYLWLMSQTNALHSLTILRWSKTLWLVTSDQNDLFKHCIVMLLPNNFFIIFASLSYGSYLPFSLDVSLLFSLLPIVQYWWARLDS